MLRSWHMLKLFSELKPRNEASSQSVELGSIIIIIQRKREESDPKFCSRRERREKQSREGKAFV